MRIPYTNITPREMWELAEAGYELTCDCDAQAVRIVRRWPRDTIKSNN
jgi:hypothetical protein